MTEREKWVKVVTDAAYANTLGAGTFFSNVDDDHPSAEDYETGCPVCPIGHFVHVFGLEEEFVEWCSNGPHDGVFHGFGWNDYDARCYKGVSHLEAALSVIAEMK